MREDTEYRVLVDEALDRFKALPGVLGKLGQGIVLAHRFVVAMA
jgi:hypothetical protein